MAQPSSSPAPPSPDLRVELLALANADRFKAMTPHEKTAAIITFLREALVQCGHERHRLFTSGYLGEALEAAEQGYTVNPSSKGYDMKDPATGETFELKETGARLGQKANVNLSVPKKIDRETIPQYYVRLRDINKSKGNLKVKHQYDGGAGLVNYYTFTHEFISFYMEWARCHLSANVNIGGTSCLACTKVHRLLNLQRLEALWRQSPSTFPTAQLAQPVPSSCRGVVGGTPRQLESAKMDKPAEPEKHE